MVKGISKQVIEISDTGSVYYERAWLIVKPAYAQLGEHLLEKEAKTVLKEVDAPSSLKHKRNFGFWFLRMGISAVLGAATCMLAQLIF